MQTIDRMVYFINQVLSMFQNGLQIHFQTLRRRCDLVILKLQLYIVIIVRITIYEQLQLQLQLQHEGQVPGEPGDRW